MTVNFGEIYVTLNYCVGVGLYFELPHARPIVIVDDYGHEFQAEFEGLVLNIPLFCITIGKVYLVE